MAVAAGGAGCGGAIGRCGSTSRVGGCVGGCRVAVATGSGVAVAATGAVTSSITACVVASSPLAADGRDDNEATVGDGRVGLPVAVGVAGRSCSAAVGDTSGALSINSIASGSTLGVSSPSSILKKSRITVRRSGNMVAAGRSVGPVADVAVAVSTRGRHMIAPSARVARPLASLHPTMLLMAMTISNKLARRR